MMALIPYTGPHARGLYHVTKNGFIARNATSLEVELWNELATLKEAIEEQADSEQKEEEQLELDISAELIKEKADMAVTIDNLETLLVRATTTLKQLFLTNGCAGGVKLNDKMTKEIADLIGAIPDEKASITVL